jgi:hypothetical protein
MKTNKKNIKSVYSNSSHPEKTKCPVIGFPDKSCYFLDMTSNKISMALYYCQNHYAQCTIYKKIKARESNKPMQIDKKCEPSPDKDVKI